MNFANAAKKYGNFTATENNAVALKTTESPLLDLFSTAGALRLKTEDEVGSMFQMAMAEDKLLAVKTMFYTRNVRGGLGERDTFRKMLKTLAKSNPEIVIKNLPLIPFFGRWDDLYVLIGTDAEEDMWKFIGNQLYADIRAMREGKPVSIMAKWLKSVNTSSKASNKLGKLTAKTLGMSEKMYRKTLAELRDYLKVIETKMSAKEWSEIEYSSVTSGAMKNYRNAFKKHDEARFASFITKVEKGEEKINAATLFPYDILLKANLSYQQGNSWRNSDNGKFVIDKDPVLEAQWKALPNYIDKEANVLVMADTSGSMWGLPICTSIGLAIYFAERNKGAYKDLFITFSRTPKMVRLLGNSLKEKLACIESEVANTDLEAAFNLILKIALDNNVPQEEMPKSLIIISDMHFDEARGGYGYFGRTTDEPMETFHATMKKKFAAHGYEMPTIIYWNVAERERAFQAEKEENGVILVSGHSTSTFKSILNNVGKTPYDFMVETLSNPMYDVIQI